MISVICQPDWATGCLDVRSNIIPVVTVQVFWIKFTLKSVDGVKQIALHNVSRLSPVT